MNTKVKTALRAVLAMITMAVLSGCATHWNIDHASNTYGFLSGLWHGFIFFFALIGMGLSWALHLVGVSFLTSVELIGRPNTGFWYYGGFAIGVVMALSPVTAS